MSRQHDHLDAFSDLLFNTKYQIVCHNVMSNMMHIISVDSLKIINCKNYTCQIHIEIKMENIENIMLDHVK